jgi:hypothetical protein
VLTGELPPQHQVMPATIDLNDLIRQGQFDLSIKPAESELDAQARRFRERITFLGAILIVGLVFVSCLGVLFFGHPPTESQHWIQLTLSPILTAALLTAFNRKSLN